MTDAGLPTSSMLTRFMMRMDASVDARLVAMFRICFFTGLLLHFAPSLWHLDVCFAPDVVRLPFWSTSLFRALPSLPPFVIRALGAITVGAMVCGLVGFKPRAAAVLTYAGTYTFASFNALHIQTLALVNAWAVLPVLCVCDGASRAWSVDAWRHGVEQGARAPGLLPRLVLFQVLLAFSFAGVEKLLWSWPMHNEMAMLFRTPRGYMVRDWAWDLTWLHDPRVGAVLGWITIGVEVSIVPFVVWKKTRLFAFAAYELFFLGIIAALEVPPLFYLMFASGAVFILDDDDISRVRHIFRRIARPIQRNTQRIDAEPTGADLGPVQNRRRARPAE